MLATFLASRVLRTSLAALGLDGKALGIELAEIRGAGDAWDYYAEASRLALQKHGAMHGVTCSPIR